MSHDQQGETLTAERASGPVIGIVPMTHGTLETGDLERSRDVYETVFGLRVVRGSKVSLFTAGRDSTGIACVFAGKAVHAQGRENAWVLLVDSAEEVRAKHARAEEAKSRGDLTIVEAIETAEPVESFTARDFDGNWWEVRYQPRDYFQTLFARGDVA